MTQKKHVFGKNKPNINEYNIGDQILLSTGETLEIKGILMNPLAPYGKRCQYKCRDVANNEIVNKPAADLRGVVKVAVAGDPIYQS